MTGVSLSNSIPLFFDIVFNVFFQAWLMCPVSKL